MKQWLAAVAGAACIMTPMLGDAVEAKEYPRRAVEMVVPFGAGGASDVFARQFSEIASEYLGAPITVVNKGGAGTIHGTAHAYKAPANGYTILEITPSVPIVEARNRSSIVFSEAFEPLMRVQADIQLIGVPKDSPLQSIDDLIAFGKENPNKLKIGGISPGGLDDYIAHGFAKEAGFEWNYIPYKGSSVMKAAVLGGELDVYQDKLISFMSLVESGDVRPLLVLTKDRIDVPVLAEVPSAVEKGINFTQGSWRGFAIKRGVEPEIKEKIIAAFDKAYADPAYKAVEQQQMTNILPGYLTAEEFGTLLEEEVTRFRAVFEELGQVEK